MSKRFLWILTGVMAVTLFGLILVQTYWIKNAIRLQHEQFGNLVNEALVSVVKRLETEETIFHISNEISDKGNDSILWSRQQSMKKSQLQKSRGGFNLSLSGTSKGGVQGELNSYLYSDDTLVYSDSKTILPSEQMKNPNASETLRQQLAQIKEPAERTRFIQRVMNRMVSVNMRIEEHISTEALKEIVKNELRNKGVRFPFQFAITNRVDGIVHQSEAFNPRSRDHIYSIPLNSNDYLSNSNYLNLQFTNEKDTLQSHLNRMSYSSFLLTLVVILIFAVTILVIFKEKRMGEIRTDFVNNMTHEFKTPISTISLASQMLKDDSIPVELKNVGSIANVIEDESKRLLEQVEKVLQTAVFEKGKLNLKPRDVDVNELLKKVTQNFSIHVEKKNGKLFSDLAAQKPIVYVDEHHITNILVNLLDNAMKYTKLVPEIQITTSDKRNAVQITISDNGIGISKKDIKHVFDQFFRVSTGNRHDVKGFGLGLSYVKKIIEAHGGVIKVESEVNKGTTFKILLPRDDD